MVPTVIRRRLKILAAAIRVARQERGWTQNDLAKRAGVPVLAVMRVEGGEPGMQVGQMLTICSTLGISSDPDQHATTPAQERYLLNLASQRKRVRKPSSDPALEV